MVSQGGSSDHGSAAITMKEFSGASPTKRTSLPFLEAVSLQQVLLSITFCRLCLLREKKGARSTRAASVRTGGAGFCPLFRDLLKVGWLPGESSAASTRPQPAVPSAWLQPREPHPVTEVRWEGKGLASSARHATEPPPGAETTSGCTLFSLLLPASFHEQRFLIYHPNICSRELSMQHCPTPAPYCWPEGPPCSLPPRGAGPSSPSCLCQGPGQYRGQPRQPTLYRTEDSVHSPCPLSPPPGGGGGDGPHRRPVHQDLCFPIPPF